MSPLLLLCALLQSPSPSEGVGIDQRLDRRIDASPPFRDETGSVATLAGVGGRRPVILALVYYQCPMLCTQVLRGLSAALRILTLEPGRDYDLVVISIDPKESPELAAAARETFSKAVRRPPERFHFWTGDESSIRKIAAEVGFRYRYDASTGLYAHAGGILVLTPDARIARYFPGIEYSSRDLRLALVEASEGRIGSLADDLLLLCFQYDPVRGRYGFAVMNAVRAGGVLAALLVGFSVWRMIRRERRRRAAP